MMRADRRRTSAAGCYSVSSVMGCTATLCALLSVVSALPAQQCLHARLQEATRPCGEPRQSTSWLINACIILLVAHRRVMPVQEKC